MSSGLLDKLLGECSGEGRSIIRQNLSRRVMSADVKVGEMLREGFGCAIRSSDSFGPASKAVNEGQYESVLGRSFR